MLAKKVTRSLHGSNLFRYFTNRNIALAIARISPNSLDIMASGNASHLRMVISSHEAKNHSNQQRMESRAPNVFSSFTTDNNTFDQTHESGVFSYFFRYSKFFQPNKSTSAVALGTSTRKTFVGNNVLAVTFVNVTPILPDKAIELNFKNTKVPHNFEKKASKCSYWNATISKCITENHLNFNKKIILKTQDCLKLCFNFSSFFVSNESRARCFYNKYLRLLRYIQERIQKSDFVEETFNSWNEKH